MSPTGMDREDAYKKHGQSFRDRSIEDDNAKLRRENKKLKKRIGSDDYLIEKVAERLESIGSLPDIKREAVAYGRGIDRELEAILCIADPHMEEVVDPNETEGMMEWNFPRFLNAEWCLIQKTLDIVNHVRSASKVKKLHVFHLGDYVTGEIHPDVYFTNQFYLPEAMVLAPFYWAQGIRQLSAHFDEIINTCVPGNHGRLDVKPTSKRTVGRNWDTAVYMNTAVQTRNLENVIWNIPKSPKTVVNVNDWYFLLQHGDQVPGHGGRVPYYGQASQRSAEMAKRIGPRVANVEERLAAGLLFDYDIRGHHHILGTTEERTFLCPSMMGNNEFGLNKTFAHKMPGARLMFVDEQEGVYGDYRINLMDFHEEHRFEVVDAWH